MRLLRVSLHVLAWVTAIEGLHNNMLGCLSPSAEWS